MWNPFARPRTWGETSGEKREGSTDVGVAVLRDDEAAAELTRAAAELDGPGPEGDGRIAQVETFGEGGAVVVVTLLLDELSYQRGAPELADLLEELVDNGRRRIVLDIQNVRFMDSACVGCIVEALNAIARSGGRIALANAAGSVAHIFRITRLDRVFPICADVMAAVNAVEREREGE